MTATINAQLTIARMHRTHLDRAARADKPQERRCERAMAQGIESAETIRACMSLSDAIDNLHAKLETLDNVLHEMDLAGVVKSERQLIAARRTGFYLVLDVLVTDCYAQKSKLAA